MEKYITLEEFEERYKTPLASLEKLEVNRKIATAMEELNSINNTSHILALDYQNGAISVKDKGIVKECTYILTELYFEEGNDRRNASISGNIGGKNVSMSVDNDNQIPDRVYLLMDQTIYYQDLITDLDLDEEAVPYERAAFATGELLNNVGINKDLSEGENPTLDSSIVIGKRLDPIKDQQATNTKNIKQNTKDIKINKDKTLSNEKKIIEVSTKANKNEATNEKQADHIGELEQGLADESTKQQADNQLRITKENNIDAVNEAQQDEIEDLQKTRALLVNNAYNDKPGAVITVNPQTFYPLIFEKNDPNSLMITKNNGASYILPKGITLVKGSFLYGTIKIALDLKSDTDLYDIGEVQIIINGVVVGKTDLNFTVAKNEYFAKVDTFQYEILEDTNDVELEYRITATKGKYSANLNESAYYTITTKNPGEASFEATTSNIIDDGNSQYKGQKLNTIIEDLDDRDTNLETETDQNTIRSIRNENKINQNTNDIATLNEKYVYKKQIVPKDILIKTYIECDYNTKYIVAFDEIIKGAYYSLANISLLFNKELIGSILIGNNKIGYEFSRKTPFSFEVNIYRNNLQEQDYKLSIMYKIPKDLV